MGLHTREPLQPPAARLLARHPQDLELRRRIALAVDDGAGPGAPGGIVELVLPATRPPAPSPALFLVLGGAARCPAAEQSDRQHSHHPPVRHGLPPSLATSAPTSPRSIWFDVPVRLPAES